MKLCFLGKECLIFPGEFIAFPARQKLKTKSNFKGVTARDCKRRARAISASARPTLPTHQFVPFLVLQRDVLNHCHNLPGSLLAKQLKRNINPVGSDLEDIKLSVTMHWCSALTPHTHPGRNTWKESRCCYRDNKPWPLGEHRRA